MTTEDTVRIEMTTQETKADAVSGWRGSAGSAGA
jgi:hypothetical protein